MSVLKYSSITILLVVVSVNTLDGQLIWTGIGEGSYDRFGWSVASAGDVNGDGYDDIIVGAEDYSGGAAYGRAYLYYGGTAFDSTADLILNGELPLNYFGWSVNSAGDVNDDGYSDVIVGAYGYDTRRGRAYVYYGGTTMDTIADVILTGENDSHRFGYSVSSAGDINNDGYDDVIVGAYRYNTNLRGRVYIYLGNTVMDTIVDVVLTGENIDDRFGYSISSAGDVNNDGYDDVIVGAFRNDAGGTNAGRVYIYYGSDVMDTIVDVTMNGEAAYDGLGNAVAAAGDVNGDGYDDVIAGARFNDAAGAQAGRAYIYYGGTAMNDTADVILTGDGASDYFGRSVATAGDVNGDTYDDVIVGSGDYPGGDEIGRAYVYYGGAAMDSTADMIMTGSGAINENFGWSVGSAGDVDGNTCDDIIIGAPNFDAHGVDVGAAYVYSSPVGINELHERRSALMLQLYPSPAKTFFTIQTPEPVHSISVYDVTGKLIKVEALQKYTNKIQMSLEKMNAGVYFLGVNIKGIEYIKKLVVTK